MMQVPPHDASTSSQPACEPYGASRAADLAYQGMTIAAVVMLLCSLWAF